MASGSRRTRDSHSIPGLGLTIRFYREVPGAIWRFRVRRKGYPQIHKSTGHDDYERALVVAVDYVERRVGGATAGDPVLDDLFDQWLEAGGISGHMAESTKKANRSGIRNIMRWLNAEGIRRLSQIDYAVGTRYKSWLDEHYSSRKTRNFHLGILKAVTRWAVDGPEYLRTDPVRKVKLLQLRQRDRKGTRSYSDDELQTILVEAALLPKPLYIGVLLGYYIGGRRSDICQLRVGDIEHAGERLYVNIIESKSKNARRQIIEQGFLQELILESVTDRPAEAPFLSWPTDSDGLHPDILGRKLSAIVRRLRITDVRFPFHTLRHTFATKLAVEKGVPLPTVMKLTGHRDMSTLLGYLDVRQDDADEALSKL